jgi:hypothetical protein
MKPEDYLKTVYYLDNAAGEDAWLWSPDIIKPVVGNLVTSRDGHSDLVTQPIKWNDNYKNKDYSDGKSLCISFDWKIIGIDNQKEVQRLLVKVEDFNVNWY